MDMDGAFPPPPPHIGTLRQWRSSWNIWAGSLGEEEYELLDAALHLLGTLLIPTVACAAAGLFYCSLSPRWHRSFADLL